MEGNLTICSLSYAWPSGGHPTHGPWLQEPCEGFANTDFLARSLLLGHKCLYQHKMNEDWNPKTQSREEGILVRRSPEEERSFQRALKGLQWLYLHAETYGVILQEVPEDAPTPTPYWRRRWPLMESMGLGLSQQTSMIGWGGKANPSPGPPVALTIAA